MILVAIPYHQNKRYVLPHLYDWLEQADLTDCDVIMKWHLGTWGEKNAVKKQRDYFRTLALKNDYSHIYFMDCDTIPPLDVIPRLLAHNKDVIGAVYTSRHTNAQTHKGKHVPLAWRDTPDPYGYLNEEGLVEVDGMGAGAVLISQKALREFDYSYQRNDDDWPVYRQLKEKGIAVYLDRTLVCKHYETQNNYY